MMFTDAIDIFTVKYLMALPAASNIGFGVSRNKIEEIQEDEETTE